LVRSRQQSNCARQIEALSPGSGQTAVVVDWLQPIETPGDGMETLGREPKPRTFNPGLAAKLLAWLGALVLVFGNLGLVYLLSTNERDGFAFGGQGAPGKVYLALATEPMLLIATAVLWGVGALLWRSNRDEANEQHRI
jgi:hypothetical protein